MLICSVLLVHVALTSSLATIKENFSLRDVSNTDRNYSNATNGTGALQNLTKQDINARNLQNLQRHAPSNTIGATTNLELVDPRKRGWGAFIFTGVTTTIRLAGLGLTLAQALSEGCVYFPSICRNKEIMERIERQLVSMRSEFERLYLENKKEYLNIATANTNNAYISYYINVTLQNFYTLEKLELKLSSTLETKVPKLYEMFEAAKNFTSEEYLESVIGRLEYRLSDINNMLKKEKQNQLIGLLIQYLVEAAVSKFMTAFSQAYQEVLGHPESILEGSDMQRILSGDIDTANPSNNAKIKTKSRGKFKFSKLVIKPLKKIRQSFKNFKKSFKSMKLRTEIKKLGSKLWKNTKLVGKTFRHMGNKLINNLKKGYKSISTTVKNIVDPKRRKSFTMDISKKYTKFKLKLQRFKTSIRNFSLKKFKSSASKYLKNKFDGIKNSPNMKTSEKVMGVVGVIADIVSQVTSALGWKKTAQTVEDARINYEKYYQNFFDELNVVKKEKAQLAKCWTQVISGFKRSTSVVRTLMNSARNYTRFNDVFGIPKLPIDTNNPIFSIKFQALNPTNTKSAQVKVIHFLKEIDNDINTVVNKMHARQTMYKKVLNMTDDGKTVQEIFESIIETYRTSETQRAFFKDLTKQDLMCQISLLRSDLMTYDFFSLDIFRPECVVNVTVFRQNEKLASEQRNQIAMKKIVTKRLKMKSTPTSLADLTEFVKTAYFAKKDPELISYGESLTEKDVMCVIATEFPSKQEFDFISLIPFRQDCKNIDDNDFKKLKKEGSKQRNKILMKIIVTKILKIQSTPKPLADLTAFVKEAYLTKDDPEMNSYGKSLTEKDVMCVIATEFPAKQEYDFISLIPFRQNCENLDENVLKKLKKEASNQRNKILMKKFVTKKIKIKSTSISLADLTALVKNAYFAKDDPEISSYGESLTERDVMCVIATEFPSKQEYDFISLIPFRQNCENVDDNDFKKLKKEATKQRNKILMKKIVTKRLKIKGTPISLADLTEFVKNAFFAKDDPEISAYGESLTEKDVMCVIATECPSKQEYDFISLIPFRQNCENVNDNDFKKLKKEAETLKRMSLQIKSTLNTCELYKFCPCPSFIANSFQIPQDQVLKLIKLTVPKMESYCGSTGCSCVKL